MPSQNRPILLLGFERAIDINALVERLGFGSDLSSLLGEHLLQVFRQQYGDLEIEIIEFVNPGNCALDYVPAEDRLGRIKTLSIPFYLTVTVFTQMERYKLDLQVTLTADRQDEKYEMKSDVHIIDQSFIGSTNTP